MRLVPSSLGGRLLAAAALFVTLAIVVAGVVIAGILGHFVRLQLDSRLDAQITAVAGTLRIAPDGAMRLTAPVDSPPFDRPDRGWRWQADRGGDHLGSQSVRFGLPLRAQEPPPDRPGFDRLRPWPAEIDAPDGGRLIARVADRLIDGEPVRILATAPKSAFTGPLLEALLPVLIAIAVLGFALFGALIVQVRLGLRPLVRLRADLGAVRAGMSARLAAENQPGEVAPLVTEINALLDRNEAGLERARRHVANLAHGLKTPLATLAVTLDEPGRDPDGAMASLVGAMDRLIRHHLARARAAALAGPNRHRTDLVPRLDDLALAIRRMHAGRAVRFSRAGSRDLVVACEAQDCDELFGNLFDNAFRHARTEVRVVATTTADGKGCVAIEDDGAGLSDGQIEQALGVGRRLDENAPGYGFGLPIASEIAELSGGGIALARGALGGLRVTVTLPLGGAASGS